MKAILIFEMLQHFENTFTESSSYLSTQTAVSFLQWFYFTFFGDVCGKFVPDVFLSLLDQDHVGNFRSGKFMEDNISTVADITGLLREYMLTNYLSTGKRSLCIPPEWITKYFHSHHIPFSMERLSLYAKGNQYFRYNLGDAHQFPQLLYSFNPYNKISKSDFIDAFLELPGAIKCLTQKNIVTVDYGLEFLMDINGVEFKVLISNQDNKTVAASTIVNEHKKLVKKYKQLTEGKGGKILEKDLELEVEEAQLQMNLLMLLFQIEIQLINRLTDLSSAGRGEEEE